MDTPFRRLVYEYKLPQDLSTEFNFAQNHRLIVIRDDSPGSAILALSADLFFLVRTWRKLHRFTNLLLLLVTDLDGPTLLL